MRSPQAADPVTPPALRRRRSSFGAGYVSKPSLRKSPGDCILRATPRHTAGTAL